MSGWHSLSGYLHFRPGGGGEYKLYLVEQNILIPVDYKRSGNRNNLK